MNKDSLSERAVSKVKKIVILALFIGRIFSWPAGVALAWVSVMVALVATKDEESADR